jgi:dihydroceramidase
MRLLIVIFHTLFLIVVIESRSILVSHTKPSDLKYFESKLDKKLGYWSPSTSSIDWCERNYVVTKYIAEFWNCISSFFMFLLSLISFIRGLYYNLENRFLVLCFSSGLVGLGSAYFHGTLTHFGQMSDELPMVYTMIVWLFILFRMNKYKLESKLSPFDILLLFGIFYGFLWTYVHSLKTFVVLFQVHFGLMVCGGLFKLIYLYKQTQYNIHSIKYLIIAYVGLLFSAMTCWIIDQQLCERMNSKNGFNPQLHAWWHVLCAIDGHTGIVCVEGMRLLSKKYQEHQRKDSKSFGKPFKPKDHLRIVFYFGLPFVDYSKEQQKVEAKDQ